MDVLKFAVLGVAAAVLAVVVKNQRPELALVLSLAAGGLLILLSLGHLQTVVGFVGEMSRQYGIREDYIGIALKVTGIAVLADLAVQLCKDAGESAIASKVELGGKAAMVVIALPVIESLLSLVAGLIR